MSARGRTAIPLATAALVVPLAVVVWLVEARIRNVEALTNMAYDAAGCASAGQSRSSAEACFASLGYSSERYVGADRVFPPLLAPLPMFTGYWLAVYFDRKGTVSKWRLESNISGWTL